MDKLIKKLKEMRTLYVLHAKNNHTETRGLCLDYYGNKCLRLKKEIESERVKD